MKKRWIVSLLFMFFLLSFCSCTSSLTDQTNTDLPTATTATLKTYQGITLLEGTQYGVLFDELLRSGSEQSLDSVPTNLYQVEISYQDGTEKNFVLFPDPLSESVYFFYEDKSYRAGRKYAEEFLGLDAMAFLYLDPLEYYLTVQTASNEIDVFVSDYEFRYLIPSGWKHLTGNQHASPQQISGSELEDLQFTFSVKPDKWDIVHYPVSTEVSSECYLCTVTATYTEPTIGRYHGTVCFSFYFLPENSD